MSSAGGDIKFKTDFPKSNRGQNASEFFGESMNNPNSVTINQDELQK